MRLFAAHPRTLRTRAVVVVGISVLVALAVTARATTGSASASTLSAACAQPVGFDDVTNLPGWFRQNDSNPKGIDPSWFQGGPVVFTAQSGPDSSFIASDYEAVSDKGTISSWLLTPELPLHNGAALDFWTRKITEVAPKFFPDRLQVRLSTNGSSTNVGSSATSVGDFTQLLLDINPTYQANGYPMEWTEYTVTLSGLSGSATGRLAFRYFVEDGGFNGTNSDYIGIDTVCLPTVAPPPPPPPPPPLRPRHLRHLRLLRRPRRWHRRRHHHRCRLRHRRRSQG